jgi:hypothetical protein
MKASVRLFSCAAVLAVSGCAWVPATQWNSLQAQNRALAEQNQVQLAEIENLRLHNQTVEDNLLRDEKQLAVAEARLRADQQRGADERVGMKNEEAPATQTR